VFNHVVGTKVMIKAGNFHHLDLPVTGWLKK
jgi:hypothetical protein